MHINVSHILAREVGDSADFDFKGENPHIPDLRLTKPVMGSFKLTKLSDGLQLTGRAHLAFELECQRCLDPYTHTADLELSASLSQTPGEDEWPISARGEVEIDPILREEALLSITIKQLCRDDCLGLCSHCGQRLDDGHQHAIQTIDNKPRIKKGQ